MVREKQYFGVPPGTVIVFVGIGNCIPDEYLQCNGDEFNASDYLALFKTIGTIYGGDGSRKFRVPILGGYFHEEPAKPRMN